MVTDDATFAQSFSMRTIFLLLLVSIAVAASAQPDTLTPPFKRYPTVPALQLVMGDSTVKYTKADLPKKKPVLLMLFSPDCEHCQHEAEMFAANSEALKDIHIVMISTYPLYRLKEFAETYKLTGLKNVVVAKDPYYILPPFYAIRNYPFMALYNKRGNLLTTIEGTATMERLLGEFKK